MTQFKTKVLNQAECGTGGFEIYRRPFDIVNMYEMKGYGREAIPVCNHIFCNIFCVGGEIESKTYRNQRNEERLRLPFQSRMNGHTSTIYKPFRKVKADTYLAKKIFILTPHVKNEAIYSNF